jgi:penicillin-binding protein 1A
MTEGQVFGARRNPANAVDRGAMRSRRTIISTGPSRRCASLVMTFPKNYTERVFVVRTAIDMNVQRAAEATVEDQSASVRP